MKNIAIRKVKDLKGPVRRTLEGVLGRTLGETEEITVLASHPVESGENGDGMSCYEVARWCKLIGIVKDAPADLSTNKEHFEGFGG